MAALLGLPVLGAGLPGGLVAGAVALAASRLVHSSAALASSLPAPAPLRPDPASLVLDLTAPASWYPAARALRRRVVFHAGPTNSGKTHAALQSLKKAGTGVYCGPLRLLAWEVAEKLNVGGVVCNLLTGQERRELPGARHLACTVEMAALNRAVDVAVIDEIQMMGDKSRGWSFTRALLGLPARTLHLCGDPAALPLVEQLCAEAGEQLEVVEYERLSPLLPSRRALGSLDKVGRGDCVVAFSRQKVHGIRQHVEGLGRHKCCVVYGALPPEARSQQATLFNTPRSGYNVLAASDAVGMGLNLQIRRIIFLSLNKFDGVSDRRLTAAETKQIAGRAGRFGSRFPEGRVTTLHKEDLPALHAALAQPSDPLESACIFPSYSQLAMLAAQLPPEVGLAGALEVFAAEAVLGPQYFFAHYSDMHTLAVMLRHLPLTLKECYQFCLSPTDPDDGPVASALLLFATAFARRAGPVTPAHVLHPPLVLARSESELQQLEATHRIYDLYCWLAYRMPDAFTGLDEASATRAVCSQLIHESIQALGPLSAARSSSSSSSSSSSNEELGASPRRPRRAEAAAEAARVVADLEVMRRQEAAAWRDVLGARRAAVQAWGRQSRGWGGWGWGDMPGRGGSSSSSGSDSESDEEWRQRKRAYAKHGRR